MPGWVSNAGRINSAAPRPARGCGVTRSGRRLPAGEGAARVASAPGGLGGPPGRWPAHATRSAFSPSLGEATAQGSAGSMARGGREPPTVPWSRRPAVPPSRPRPLASPPADSAVSQRRPRRVCPEGAGGGGAGRGRGGDRAGRDRYPSTSGPRRNDLASSARLLRERATSPHLQPGAVWETQVVALFRVYTVP